ncbi:MAG: hypothetical protein GY838_17950 [bacterium]|nr:hypothetical protein [bacterium]
MFLLAAVVLTAAPISYADDDPSRGRRWGLGWDEGLTLRRWVGPWELGVAAGPNDWLDESDSRTWDTDEPDSLQGRDDEHYKSQRESGFVRLQLGRRMASEGILDFMGHVNLQYLWSDERWVHDYYYTNRITFSTTDNWVETWSLSTGIRLALRPWEFLTVETTFGLTYSWGDREEIRRRVERDLVPPLESDRVTVEQTKSSTRRFDDDGWYGMGSLSFIYWF